MRFPPLTRFHCRGSRSQPARNLRLTLLVLSVAAGTSFAAEETPKVPAAAALKVAELKRDTPVDFEKEILPVLKNNCLACHNTTKAKASLNLETPQLILKGGDNGPGVVPGKSAESLLFKASAHLDPELIMPPRDNKANASNLNPDQLALLKLWIDQGATGEVHAAAPVKWLDKPPVLEPILALDLTRDGQFAVCGRGSRVDVYHVPSRQLVARLTDPKLQAAGLPPSAHRDLVNAVAFHPDGTLLASAGYREIKLWRRGAEVQTRTLKNTGTAFAVSPDRKWLAAVGSDHAVRLVDVGKDSVVHTWTNETSLVTGLAFSPDSQRLACVSAGKNVRVWNLADGVTVGAAEMPCELNAVAWVDAGRQLAWAGTDGKIRLGALTNLASPRELISHSGAVAALAPVGDGAQLISGGDDGVLRQWKVEDGALVRQLTNGTPGTAISRLAVAPEGKRLALAGTNAVVQLWDLESGKMLRQFKGNRYANERVGDLERALVVAQGDVAFHKKSVESATNDLKKVEERIARARDTNNVTEKVFLEKEKALKLAEESKVGAEKALTNLLAEIVRVTESFEKADATAKEAASRATAAAAKATEAQLAAERAALSRSDADKIAADTASVAGRTKAAIANADAARDTARRIADESAGVAEKSRAFADAISADAEMKGKLATEARVAATKAIEDLASLAFAAGQLKPNYDKTLAEAPEKRKQATNQVQTTAKAFTDAEKEFKRAETRKSVTRHELELATAAGLKSSNTLASAEATLASAETAQKKTETLLEEAKQQSLARELPALALAFSPDGRTLATLSADGHLHTWSGDSGEAFDVFPRPASPSPSSVDDVASGVAFLNATSVLAGVASAQAVEWNLNPGWTLERTIGTGDSDSLFADRVNALRFSPDGQILATGGGEPTRSGEIKLFNVADGKLVRELGDVHSDAVLSLDFAPNGKFLASSSADRFAKVVDLATGKVVKAFEGHTSYVLGVAWKRDSRTLVSAGADKVIKVWDFVTGDRRKNIEGADKDVTGVAYVGVTDQMVATSGDSQVRLLKENGEKVRSFEGAKDFLNSTAATPDGRVIVAGGQDGMLHVWSGADGQKLGSFAPEK